MRKEITCSVCGVVFVITSWSRRRKTCTQACTSKAKGVSGSKRSKESHRLAAKKGVATRIANGSEQRRIQAVKKAHANGSYSTRNKRLSTRMTDINHRNWANQEWIDNFLATVQRPINGFEKRVIMFMESFQLPFRYTGNWKLWIHDRELKCRRNPDFAHTDSTIKIAVLAHGTYWHRDSAKVERELEHYRRCGWRAFIIWESDKLDLNIAQKLNDFVRGVE